jgi:hypothetical protein
MRPTIRRTAISVFAIVAVILLFVAKGAVLGYGIGAAFVIALVVWLAARGSEPRVNRAERRADRGR